MAQSITYPDRTLPKTEKYDLLCPQIVRLLSQQPPPLMAGLGQVAAVLKYGMDFFWAGFYMTDEQTQQLVLGPFQGEFACTYIPYGRGVCGTAWQEARTLVVPDTRAFPGHIMCSPKSRSEIVVPVWHPRERQILAVLDIDSDRLDAFDETDKDRLEGLMEKVSPLFLAEK